MNTLNRDLSFDALKGILILFVVIGHSIADCFYKIGDVSHNVVFNAIYLFHMPLFIFVSGYFANSMTKYTFPIVFRRKAKRLILPWVIWSSFSLLIWFSSSSFYSLDFHTKDAFVEIGKNLYRTYAQYIWFLPCVFVLTIMYYPILRCIHDGDRKYIFICVMIFLVWIVSVIFNKNFPFNYIDYLQISRQALPFGLGLFYFYCKDRLNNEYRILIVLLAVIGIIGGFNKFGIYRCDFSMVEKIYSGTLLTIIMFYILWVCWLQIKKVSIIRNLLCWCGQNSLGIYVIHMTWRTIFKRFEFFPVSLDSFSILKLVVIYLVLSVVTIFFCKEIIRSKILYFRSLI